jgi:UDP-N-acetylmuramoyl-L-alanyl-D-glutamate--2,6-diaminopimelate ligase
MRLSALIDDEADLPAGHADPEIRGLSADSRRVAPGDLFAALAGAKANGARFAGEAVARGAVAVLIEAGATIPDLGVPIVRAREPRRALALMAARYSGAQPATALAVTGTSGKTSVAEFTRQILAALGRRAASLGTIGVVKPDGAVYGSLTTPDPVTLHATLAELAREGVTHLAFEASSHGLDQHRLDGVRLTAAAFTNLGRDHMDYHPTVEHYLAAKLRLFRELLQPGQTAVVNADGAMSEAAIEAARARRLALLTVGRDGETLRLEDARREGFAQRLTIRHGAQSHDVRLPLIGAYQVENALVAAGLAIAAGEDPGRTIAALETLRGVKGRLEIVGELRGGLVVVDYAHKPEALIAALAACRPFATGELVCVFGCGGDRDKGKRPIMGAIAAEAADRVVVSDDNPRSERPEAIRADILAGIPAGLRAKVREIGDRQEAIHAAIASIGSGDVVLIAGKGHETGQIVGDTVLPFSDHEVAEAVIRREAGHG